jgi:hypothetical protein
VVYVSDRLWFMGDRAGPIRGLWRLLDEKVESGLMSDSELRGGSPRPCRLRTDRLAPVSKFEMCTDACGILWGPVNLVTSVTAWSSRNRYSMVVVGGRMRYPRTMVHADRSLRNQDFIPSVEERF